jgi:hypothetical protein
MIVYTSIFGAYDSLKPHPVHGCVDRWICFTDDPGLSCDGWDIVLEPPRGHPRMSAKWRKTHPPDDDCSLWVDGSISFNEGLIDAALEGLSVADMALWRHPERTSIIVEAAVSVRMEKYRSLPVERQAAHYVNDWGWPDNQLWAAGVIARRHTTPVMQMGAAWYAECEHWTYQDQISLPPLLGRYGIYPVAFEHSIWSNPWTRITGHASNQ